MEAMQAPVYFEKYDVTGDMPRVPEEVIESIRKNKMCLKGGLATPMGGSVSSLNMQLRRDLDLDLYASLVNCFNLRGLQTKHGNVDILVIRENTEGEYSGLEHEIIPGVVESLKVRWLYISDQVWDRIALGLASQYGVCLLHIQILPRNRRSAATEKVEDIGNLKTEQHKRKQHG
ncbi:isocitrate dehydrogenase [NAD] regulatory subunit 1, mitochondrial-like [Rosa rugosa]|uniref:isocitrate dehydrogenase [NAD] regulatory subunit 1, mitochondrial-like n=1 Tax=Rosa rugosa TaxID=74645 RepID=UPI002B40EABD|nr:isocitrate dehydrogenase [NAD] regulatory subunit 1, mitochondrial-like [Rosa rugosa]